MASRQTGSGRLFLRRLSMGVAAVAAVGAIMTSPAEARHFRRHYARHHHAAFTAGPPFAAVVVDENNGRTLYSVNENELRHPASITKVMTLYLLFEKLESGELTLQSRLDVSQHAANQEPSKLGLSPGDTISVDDAIKAIVTRSANDVAVVIAENLGGTESGFAQQMTRKAHELGMTRTNYADASGLPNPMQLTTAHDLAILARAVQERFPTYFKYFSTHEFEYAGQTIGSHNRLIGRVDGVDGIKTGYTNASGFNLMTSMHKNGRSIVAIVLGGRTAAGRDRIMQDLLAKEYEVASVGHRTGSVFAEAAPTAPVARPVARPMALAFAEPVAVKGPDVLEAAPVLPPASVPAPALIAAATPHAKSIQVASLAPVVPDDGEDAAPIKPSSVAASKLKLAVVEQGDASVDEESGDVVAPKAKAAPALPTPRPAALLGKADTSDGEDAPAKAAKADAHNGWVIQIGATDDQSKAKTLLQRAIAQNRAMLASAKPLTEKFTKGEDTFYRARFAMNDSSKADAACKSLKKTGFSCIAMHD